MIIQRLERQQGTNKPAFALITSVLILLGLATIGITIGYLTAINLVASGSVDRDAAVAKAAAESCVEITLNELLLSDTYTAGDVFSVGAESCSVTQVTGTGNAARGIQTESTVGESTAKITVTVDILRPNVIISEWQITN